MQKKISHQKLFLLEYCSETSINFPVQKNWEYLRENNDNKIQPVPRVTKEGEFSHTKASCKDFNEWFKSIYSSKSISKENNQLKWIKSHWNLHSFLKHLLDAAGVWITPPHRTYYTSDFKELLKCPYESYSQKTQVLKELRTKVLDLPWQSQ